MGARWDPASTARTEFLDHCVAVERTRKPVTLSSLGPPPDPWSAVSFDPRPLALRPRYLLDR
jgi:hypothetical protein